MPSVVADYALFSVQNSVFSRNVEQHSRSPYATTTRADRIGAVAAPPVCSFSRIASAPIEGSTGLLDLNFLDPLSHVSSDVSKKGMETSQSLDIFKKQVMCSIPFAFLPFLERHFICL